MSGDRPLLVILLMLGFCLLAPFGDALAKLLGGSVGLGVLMLTRFLFQAGLLWPVVLRRGRPLGLTPRLWAITVLRALLHIGGIGTIFTALRYLPLADALAIAFVMPFLMLLLGWLFLGEEVGPHRLTACAVGFAGVLLVIRPNFAETGWPALLPLATALCFTLFTLVTRAVSRRIDPIALQALSGLQAALVLVPLVLILPAELVGEFGWSGRDTTLLLIALGVTGTLGHLLMTWSLRYAPAATLAPIQYVEIPFATVIGWAMFRDLPDGLALVGILVTMAAGLWIIARERAIAAPARRAP